MPVIYRFMTVVVLLGGALCASDPADLQQFPQQIGPYLKHVRARTDVLPVQRHYADQYYRVWDDDYVPDALRDVKWPFEVYGSENAFGENLRPLSQAWFYSMLLEANWQGYASLGKRAIALKRLDLRNFPTYKPLFHDPSQAGEGFPFDYLQNSTVFANEPLYLSHYSKSGRWAYVLTSYATGWVPVERVAPVDSATVSAFRRSPLVALLLDTMTLCRSNGAFVCGGKVGMLLPLREKKPYVYQADVARMSGGAFIHPAATDIPKHAAAIAPMRFEPEALARVIAPIMGTKYGWGGLYGERDCSSTLRDIFAPFGIWLPRNSYQQAGVGRVVSLAGLNDKQKLEKIKRDGQPFETLLYLKGHILLYLGIYDDEPAVLHTLWGIKTVETSGGYGRHIVGKTVISSLQLGKELPGYRAENSLLRKLKSMNFILEAPAQ